MDAVTNDKNSLKRGKTIVEPSPGENKKVERPRAASKPSGMKLGISKQKSKDGNKPKGKDSKKDDDYIE